MNKIFGASGVVGAFLLMKNRIEHSFPDEGMNYYPGQKVINSNGVEKVVINYFGSSDKIHRRGMDFTRHLYYADKKGAQGYALRRVKEGEKAVVAVIIADKMPTHHDHMPGHFEGYSPLSPEYLLSSHAEVFLIEEVNLKTRKGFLGSMGRMVHHIRQGNRQIIES